MPKVSVITPVYNGEKYIKTAIDSLLAQSFQDWESIIVDDGSSDATPHILQQYGDARIHVIHQQNGGEATARNTGLAHACGEYVAFLDADDYYLPTALADLAEYLDQHPEFSVIYSNGQICDSDGNAFMTLTEIRPGIYTGNILEQVVVSSSVVTVPICTMTRRSAICDHGIEFDRNLVIGPDWDFWIQLAAHVGFGYLDRLTCTYRVHNKNITRTINIKKRKHDQIYGRLKVMKADWFAGLSDMAKDRFFYDLLINLATGDPQTQLGILHSQQVAALPDYIKVHLWHMTGIDVLKNDPDPSHARQYLQEALKIDPNNRKIRLILGGLRIGRWFTLGLINAWHFLRHIIKSVTSLNYTRSRKLQKYFGLR